MADYTTQEMAQLYAGFVGLSGELQTLLGAHTAKENADAIAALTSTKRSNDTITAISSLVSGSVSNWSGMDAAAAAGDAATLPAALAAAKAARIARDVSYLAKAVAVEIAAEKHFGL